MMMRYEHPKNFFSKEEEKILLDAIAIAESKSCGEIRVHLQKKCKDEPMEEAKRIFEKLGMTQTQKRIGILFFLSLADHHFVVLGDTGIHEKVKDDFWHAIRNKVLEHFKNEEFIEGLKAGILKCGEKLGEHFPRDQQIKNELSNEISVS